MPDEATHQISPAGYAALEAELHELETEGRRAIAERIKTAREWGDLSENAEYHDAKEAQAHLETKILRLRSMRDSAVVVETTGATDVVALGSVVTVRDLDSGREQRHEIVGAAAVRPGRGTPEHRRPARPRAVGREGRRRGRLRRAARAPPARGRRDRAAAPSRRRAGARARASRRRRPAAGRDGRAR